MNTKRSKVLIIDDSALMRQLLSAIVAQAPDLEVAGTAPDPLVAREMIKQLEPDVLTLDIEMPKMDGLDFLERLMRLRPMPVVMVSSLTQRGSEQTLRALELGAVEVMGKPKLSIREGMIENAGEIIDKIRAAAKAKVHPRSASPRPAGAAPAALGPRFTSSEKIIVIGASTGGPEAVRRFLEQMPADGPGILIAQHMAQGGFIEAFARRLDEHTRLSVAQAGDRQRILPGHVYIAPADRHLKVTRSGANYMTALDDGAPVSRHRPSVDVLFDSAASAAAHNAIGVILTGMGRDGAQGLLTMRRAGAKTYAQDEASCVVYGMPREAVELGAVDEIAALDDLPARILELLAEQGSRALRV
jgi:two-component system, chemotaxis family, protein-glutamate methylesterase/glutaminase